ncbi:MAG: prenyltransferase [Candidatus Kapabacteria bacterium]|jgi:1,4-dihydroxy-2-naphthoate octaprenyltransferase|nr:prenyltransferase [Candidatus Kapabacteria bacterium]
MMQPLLNWIQAARIPSVINILIPILFGVSFSIHSVTNFEFFLLLFLSFLFSLTIVFLNDVADVQADKNNSNYTLYSGGSRVIQDNKLSQKSIEIAGYSIAMLLVIIGVVISVLTKNTYLFLYPIASILLLFCYSYPPLKLNYRGGGELLQGIGCGIVLPMFGFSLYSGSHLFDFSILLPYCALHTASSIGTSLPDTEADIKSNKKTVAAIYGKEIGSFIAATIIIMTTIIAFLIKPSFSSSYLLFGFMIPLILPVIQCTLIPIMKRKRIAVFFSGMLPLLAVVSFSLGRILP